jgi:phosphonatase-like hydrolase
MSMQNPIKETNLQPNLIRLVMFDMAGTTMDDVVEGYPLVIGAAIKAFAQHGLELAPEMVNAQRGREKKEMMAALLEQIGAPSNLLESVYARFLLELERGLDGIQEMAGAAALFRKLHSVGILVGLGSGFPTDLMRKMLSRLGWQREGLIDYAASAEEVGEGRPSPAMIHAAMKELGVPDPKMIVKIGDTIMDVREGKNASALTAAVLTGTQSREQLAQAQPDYILPGIGDLLDLLETSAGARLRRPTLEEAIALAAQAHRGQVEKAGQPYILHPLRVMLRFRSEPEQIVGVLHDLIEDTNHTLSELRHIGYTEEIIQAIDALSKKSGESYVEFIERVAANPLAKRVKLADLEDNMDIRRLSEITERDQERLRRYQSAWRHLQEA